MCVCAGVHMLCCYYLVLAVTVICLNPFLLLFVFLNSFVHSHVTLNICFESKFPFKDNNALSDLTCCG